MWSDIWRHCRRLYLKWRHCETNDYSNYSDDQAKPFYRILVLLGTFSVFLGPCWRLVIWWGNRERWTPPEITGERQGGFWSEGYLCRNGKNLKIRAFFFVFFCFFFSGSPDPAAWPLDHPTSVSVAAQSACEAKGRHRKPFTPPLPYAKVCFLV